MVSRPLQCAGQHGQHLLRLGLVVVAEVAQDRRMADAQYGGNVAYGHVLSAHRDDFSAAPVAFRFAAHVMDGTLRVPSS